MNNSPRYYVWMNGKAVPVSDRELGSQHWNLFVIDTYMRSVDWQETDCRYGWFRFPKVGGVRIRSIRWESLPFDMLPEEFRMHALLLGIT